MRTPKVELLIVKEYLKKLQEDVSAISPSEKNAKKAEIQASIKAAQERIKTLQMQLRTL